MDGPSVVVVAYTARISYRQTRPVYGLLMNDTTKADNRSSAMREASIHGFKLPSKRHGSTGLCVKTGTASRAGGDGHW